MLHCCGDTTTDMWVVPASLGIVFYIVSIYGRMDEWFQKIAD